MNAVIQSGFLLMAAGMGTVFVSLGIFFGVIIVLEKICKSKDAGDSAKS